MTLPGFSVLNTVITKMAPTGRLDYILVKL